MVSSPVPSLTVNDSTPLTVAITKSEVSSDLNVTTILSRRVETFGYPSTGILAKVVQNLDFINKLQFSNNSNHVIGSHILNMTKTTEIVDLKTGFLLERDVVISKYPLLFELDYITYGNDSNGDNGLWKLYSDIIQTPSIQHNTLLTYNKEGGKFIHFEQKKEHLLMQDSSLDFDDIDTDSPYLIIKSLFSNIQRGNGSFGTVGERGGLARTE